jgi:hypothetical protein
MEVQMKFEGMKNFIKSEMRNYIPSGSYEIEILGCNASSDWIKLFLGCWWSEDAGGLWDVSGTGLF